MATIDKNSITVIKTADPSIYNVSFDFTDSTSLDPNQGWLVTWLHASFISGSTATTAEFNAAALESMKLARRPTAESDFETNLRSKYGISIIRSDPNPPESTNYQKFELAAISTGVIMVVTT